MDGVHDVGATGDRGERHTAGDALGRRHEVGDDALVVAGEPVAAAAEAGLHLVGDEEDVVVPAPLRQGREEARGGTMKPPSPWIGSMMTAAVFSSPIWAWIWSMMC